MKKFVQIGTSQSMLRTAGNLLFVIGVLTALPATAYAQLAWAHVQASGTIDNDSGNITVSRPDAFPGGYCIGVTGGTAQAAVVSLDSLPNVGGSVQAGVFFASVCSPFPNAQNILVVTRPQAQDGGFPGQDRAFYIIVAGVPLGPVGAKITRHDERIPAKMRRDRMAATAARREPLG